MNFKINQIGCKEFPIGLRVDCDERIQYYFVQYVLHLLK